MQEKMGQKDSLAVAQGISTFIGSLFMKLKSSTLFCLAAALIVSSTSGCNLFRRSKKPKENPAIAAEVETEYRLRWVDRRTGELVAQGKDAGTAKNQAEMEFGERYPVLKERKK